MRRLIGAGALELPAGPPRLTVSDLDSLRFRRRVRYQLDHPEDEPPLERIAVAFELSKTELAALFGVRRQAVDQWRARGVPGDRQQKLQTVLALVDLVVEELREPAPVAGLAADFRWTEEIGSSLVVREPAGVVGAITPWNFPLQQIARRWRPPCRPAPRWCSSHPRSRR